jgi:hypothetical protein
VLPRTRDGRVHELRHTGGPRALDQVDRLGQFAFEGAPVHVGHLNREDGAGPLRGPDHGVAVVEVAGDQLGTEGLDGQRPAGCPVTDQRPDRNTRREQGTGSGAALSAGGAGDQYGCGFCGHHAPRVVALH